MPTINNSIRNAIPSFSTSNPRSDTLPIQTDFRIYQQRERGSISFDTFNSESLLESEAKMRRWQVRRKTLIWKVLRALRRAVSLSRMADRVLGDVKVGDTWGCEGRNGGS